MSCHNASGAVTAYKNISSAINHATGLTGTPSATNPFGDLLTNAYDQKVRPAVVAVYDQFNPTNPSHHAVRATKYSGRSRYTTPGANRGVASQTPLPNTRAPAMPSFTKMAKACCLPGNISAPTARQALPHPVSVPTITPAPVQPSMTPASSSPPTRP